MLSDQLQINKRNWENAKQISRRQYLILSSVVMAASVIVQLSPMILSRNIFVQTGYGAAANLQGYFVATTGHLYQGQWNSAYSLNELQMGWANIGQNSDLLQAILYGLIQIVTGSSFVQSFYFSYLPIGTFMIPLFTLGFYKFLAGKNFSYNNALILLGFSCFGSISFIEISFFSQFGMSYFFYLLALMLVGLSFSTSLRAEYVIFVIAAAALTMSYHTLAQYAIIIFVAMLFVELLTYRRGKGTDLRTGWVVLGLAIILVLAVYMFSAIVFSFRQSLSSYLLNLFSASTILPGVQATNITTSLYSRLDIITELIAAVIFVIGFALGTNTVIRRRRNRELSYAFYLTISLFVLAISLIAGLGFFTTLSRAFQATYVFIPLILAVMFLYAPKNIKKFLMVIALMNIILVPFATIAFNNEVFGISGNTLTQSTFSQVSFVGTLSSQHQSIFTNFAVAGTMLFYGHVDVFGLSDYVFSQAKFSEYADSIYLNGTSAEIRNSIHQITGSSALFLYQNTDREGIQLETNTYLPNPSFINTYEGSFDILYASNYNLVLVIP
jgi:hypothetical protein